MSFFSRVTLRAGVPADRLVRLLPTSPYEDHRLLWRLFPGQKAGRFLYRRADDANRLRYYLVSESRPVPTVEELRVETKEYDPRVPAGRRLSFMLRVNPVVSRRDDAGRLHRHDVVMDAKSAAREERSGISLSPVAKLAQDAGLAWLSQRASRLGFEAAAEDLVVEGYQRQGFRTSNGHSVTLGVLDLAGLLETRDEDAFRRALLEGVGPAKGFGCGLLLVRPAR